MHREADSDNFASSEIKKDGALNATLSNFDRTARQAWQSKPKRNL
jgi:hypothetical protein